MRARRFSDWCLCGLFVTMLGWGGVVSLWNIWLDRTKLPLLADMGWTWFPTKFESFFNDHLAARERMTAMLGRVKMRCLKSSPTPRVWVGRDEWLFYNHNADPKPFIWTKFADEILKKVAKAKQPSESKH